MTGQEMASVSGTYGIFFGSRYGIFCQEFVAGIMSGNDLQEKQLIESNICHTHSSSVFDTIGNGSVDFQTSHTAKDEVKL